MTETTQLRIPVGPGDHIRGPLDAPYTLVEYGDYECPHCAAAYPVVEAVRVTMKSVVRFVYRHFPLTNVHPHAERAAEAAEAAGAQQKFWAMHDQLFRHQDALDAESLVGYGALIDLDIVRFARDVASREYLLKVRKDFMGGVRSGVNGTPTFFINGLRYNGPRDVKSMVTAIHEARMPAGQHVPVRRT